MAYSVFEERDDEGITHGVVRELPLHPISNQLHHSHTAKLMGGGRYRQVEDLGEVAHAQLLLRQSVEDPHPGGVREHLEGVRYLLHEIVREHGVANPLDTIFIDIQNLAAAIGHLSPRRWNPIGVDCILRLPSVCHALHLNICSIVVLCVGDDRVKTGIDPVVWIKPPPGRAGRARDMRTLKADELGRVLAEVERAAPQRYAEVYVLAHTGMRPGELFALEWRDVDEERGKIVIERAVRRGRVDTPKTEDPRGHPPQPHWPGPCSGWPARIDIYYYWS